MTAGGIFPALVGTIWLVAVALLASVPLGVAAAIYLSEYAPDNWLTRSINLAIINLAGVPSIVHALFGVGAFVLFFEFGTSILAASLTLAIMTLPVVIVATRESLQAVPHGVPRGLLEHGRHALADHPQVVLPNSVSGILTGVILEVSRTAGETAPIMFTGAAFFLPFLPQSVFDQTMALSLHLFVVSTQVPGVPEHLPYGVALVLIGMVLADERRLDRLPHVPAREEEVVAATAQRARRPRSRRDLTIRYGSTTALEDVSLDIRENEIFGIIGPANSGKTSFLSAINRMDDVHAGMHVDGDIEFDGRDVRQWRNVYALRRRIGVVFPLPVGLPLTVYDNVALAPRLAASRNRPTSTRSSSAACAARPSGTRSRTGWTPWAACSPAASSSA